MNAASAVAMLARAVALLSVVVIAVGCASPDEDVASGDGAVINGTVAAKGSFSSVVRINESCTATQVARRLLLTASHCIRMPNGQPSASFAAGRNLTVESRRSDGKLAMTNIPIAYAKIHPRLTKVCAAENGGAGCQGSSAAAGRDAPDVAIVKLSADIPFATVTPITVMPSKVGDELILAGFGCTERVGGPSDDRLRSETSPVIDPSELNHRGSPTSSDEATRLAKVYVYTEGPALRGSAVGGLCPGDSGGPTFRRTNDGLVVVGVNSSYTFLPKSAVPATNWSSRVDVFASHEIFRWLELEGATYKP